MRWIARAILALLAFGLARAAVALPPEQPSPGATDEAMLRRIATSAAAPPLAASRAKLNAALTAKLRTVAATSLHPAPSTRTALKSTPFATCSAPAITGVRGEPNGDGTITPDNTFEVTGCDFGATPGSAAINLPGRPTPLPLTLIPVCASADFTHEISCWQDYGAVFRVPHVEGIGDSSATLALTTAGGQTLRVPIRFVALRKMAMVYGAPPIYGKCSHATNNDDCITTPNGPLEVAFEPSSTNYSILAIHQSLCCFNGVRDHDDYQVSLASQWTVASIEIAVNAQLPYCSNAFSSPNKPLSSAVLEAPAFSPDRSAVSFRVDYSVGPVCSEIVYALAIVARGPLGTFYMGSKWVGPPAGHR